MSGIGAMVTELRARRGWTQEAPTQQVGVLRFGARLWPSLPMLNDHPEIDKEVLLEHIERGLVGQVMRVAAQDGSIVTVALEE